MLIEVIQEDIDYGIRGSLTGCAVARALNRCLGTEYGIWRCGPRYIYCGSNVLFRRNTPAVVQEFIKNFDQREDVGPFSFELPPEKSVSISGIKYY